jgi:hypothetical protein
MTQRKKCGGGAALSKRSQSSTNGDQFLRGVETICRLYYFTVETHFLANE